MLIAYLIKHRGMTFTDAHEVLTLGRPIVNIRDHHLEELNEYEKA